MRKNFIRVLALAITLSCATATNGLAYLIDTGAGPTSTTGSWSLYNDAGNIQYLAAEFSLGLPSTVTSIDGWMGIYKSGNLRVTIYDNSGSGAIPGVEVFHQDFHLDSSDQTNLTAAWYGTTVPNWSLASGTYWVAFEVPEAGFYGVMPNVSNSPLEHGAGFNPLLGPGYVAADYVHIGVRIDGSQVPIPGAVWLLGSGLLGLGGWRRFRKG